MTDHLVIGDFKCLCIWLLLRVSLSDGDKNLISTRPCQHLTLPGPIYYNSQVCIGVAVLQLLVSASESQNTHMLSFPGCIVEEAVPCLRT